MSLSQKFDENMKGDSLTDYGSNVQLLFVLLTFFHISHLLWIFTVIQYLPQASAFLNLSKLCCIVNYQQY